MPLPADPFASLVSTLSKGARAAYPFIRGLAVSQPNLSPTAIYDQLRAAGFPLRKQTALDIVSLLRNKSDLPRFQRTFGSDAVIPDSLHNLSPVSFKGGARVQYLVGIQSANPLIPDAVYINARSNLSINQVFTEALGTITGGSFGPGSQVKASDVTQVTIEDARYTPGAQTTGEFAPPEL
jgi:hypothetical protein